MSSCLEGGGQKGRSRWAREGEEKELKEKYLARCSGVYSRCGRHRHKIVERTSD